MSRKNVLLPCSMFISDVAAATVSMASDITFDPINIQYEDSVGFQLSWTGDPTGTFDVQGSLDKVTWNSITLSATISAAGADGSGLIDMFALSFPYIRLVYTAASGAGTLTALVTGKNLSS